MQSGIGLTYIISFNQLPEGLENRSGNHFDFIRIPLVSPTGPRFFHQGRDPKKFNFIGSVKSLVDSLRAQTVSEELLFLF